MFRSFGIFSMGSSELEIHSRYGECRFNGHCKLPVDDSTAEAIQISAILRRFATSISTEDL